MNEDIENKNVQHFVCLYFKAITWTIQAIHLIENWHLNVPYRCEYFQLLFLSTLSSSHRVLTFDWQFVVISTESTPLFSQEEKTSLYIKSLFSRMVSLYLKRCPVSFEEETLDSCLAFGLLLLPLFFYLLLLSTLQNPFLPDLFNPIFFPLLFTLARLKPKGTLCIMLWRDHQKFFGKRVSFCLFVLWKWFIFVLCWKQQPFVQSMNSELTRNYPRPKV